MHKFVCIKKKANGNNFLRKYFTDKPIIEILLELSRKNKHLRHNNPIMS